MEVRPKTKAGLSLVELLVVIGIIGTMSVVAIPVIARTGLFTSNKADLAARELFTMLRAAKIYATTYNVETAVAYGGRTVRDSDSGLLVPIVDSVAIVRRLSRKELDAHIPSADPTSAIYVPLRSREGNFRSLPNRTCILPDFFETQELNTSSGTISISAKGLDTSQLFDPDAEAFIDPRDNYGLYNPGGTAEFPAHRFSPEGKLIPPDNFPQQRITLRVGMLPDAEISDRFFLDPSDTNTINDPDGDMTLFFSQPVTVQPLVESATGDPIDIDVEIDLFVATGRIEVRS